MHNIHKAGKNELNTALQVAQNTQDLMTILMQHIDNKNKTIEEKMTTIGQFALQWYDMSTYTVNDITKEIIRRKESV